MEFSIIAEIFEKMEKTSKRTELTEILVELLQKTPKKIIPIIVYLLQGIIRPNFEGVELGIAEKLAIRAISKSSGLPIKKIEDGYRDDGDLGITASNILKLKTQTTFTAEKITIERVYETLFKIAKLEGKGSQDLKMKYISSLLNDATPLEAKFVLKILLSTLRLGIAENTVMDALAIAFTGKKENKEQIENAYNVSSDLGKVSLIVATNGIDEIKKFKISLFNPIRPMLADRAKSEQEVIKKMPELFAAEYKLDGERVQIHIQANKIILFSRRLENITQYYPDIVENVRKSLDIHEGVFEAEIVPINENTGEFLPFQELMHRRRKYNLVKAVSQYPITVNFFDVLYFDKKDCLNLAYSERRKILERVVNEDNFSKLIPMKFIKSENEITDFLENSINAGCEGLMLKTPNAPYRAGSRGSNWLKLKREYRNELGDSLDLIVIGAYFGRGRRTGLYGTLLLGTFNPETNNFPSICKVGTGFTDESLDQLYQILSNKVTLKKNSKIVSEMEADVWFEPELVLEIVASEITLSPIHKTGMDLIRKESGFPLTIPKFTGKIRYEKAVEDVNIVIHTAALKQVPVIEYNPFEAIKTNVQGAQNLVEACLNKDVEFALAIGTDKAVSPFNTYGATKLLMERLFVSANYYKGYHKTKFACVRYGNVLGSRGSIIPKFIEQIMSGNKITITDPNMTRFSITMDQALDLIFRVIKNAVGGDVHIPKLEAYRVGDIKDVLLDLMDSKNEEERIPVRIGEKHHEILINTHEIRNTYENQDNDYVIYENQLAKDQSKNIPNAKKTTLTAEYSSDKVKTTSKEELKEILSKQNFIPKNF